MGKGPPSRSRGRRWVAAQMILLGLAAFAGLRWAHQWHSPALHATGGVLLALSAASGLPGVLTLGRRLTPFPRPRPGHGLVQHGIYGWMRHPLYTSVALAALGWGLVRGSWPALAFAVAIGLLLDAKSRREEAWLREEYPEYCEYEKRVRRFIPGIY